MVIEVGIVFCAILGTPRTVCVGGWASVHYYAVDDFIRAGCEFNALTTIKMKNLAIAIITC
jgi:hypothetical protein